MAKKSDAANGSEALFQTSTREVWKRSEIKPDPANPRFIDPYSRKKLRRSIKENGLVGGIIVNRKTKQIVGGHQRLELLDEIVQQKVGKNKPLPDYSVPVDVVERELKGQRILNVTLNNPGVGGQFDFGKLADLFDLLGDEWTETGMDRIDYDAVYAEAGRAAKGSLFSESDGEAEEKKAISDLKMDAKAYQAANGNAPLNEQAQRESENARMNAKRKHWKERQDEENSPDFILEVVFNNEQQLTRFLEATGFPVDSKFVNGGEIATLCGVEIDEPEPQPAKKGRKAKK